MRDVDLLVFGRKTYQLMVPFWPDVAKNYSKTKGRNEFAQTFDSINKIVFSQSLDGAEGKNTRIVRTKLQDEILKLGNSEFLWVHPGILRKDEGVKNQERIGSPGKERPASYVF